MLNYTTLPLPAVAAELAAVADTVSAEFGGLDEQQLNWRPAPERWSVAQCLEHLLHANRDMLAAIGAAVAGSARPRITPSARAIDGCRLTVAHEHRHVQQARRVTADPGFPIGRA